MSIEELFQTRMEFSDFELITYEKGHFAGKIRVNDTDTNLYGNVHGGFLFTLCDNASVLVAYSLGYFAVSMNASISYLKAAKKDEVLRIEAYAIHAGKTTSVVEVEILNAEGELICKATFTMFNSVKIDENRS